MGRGRAVARADQGGGGGQVSGFILDHSRDQHGAVKKNLHDLVRRLSASAATASKGFPVLGTINSPSLLLSLGLESSSTSVNSMRFPTTSARKAASAGMCNCWRSCLGRTSRPLAS